MRRYIALLSGMIVLGGMRPGTLLGQHQPVAMDRSGFDAPLYVLDESGDIYRSHSASNVTKFDWFGKIQLDEEAIDLFVTQFAEGEQIFVLSGGTSFKSPPGTLTLYSARGDIRTSWKLPSRCAGLTVDASGRSAFLATSSGNEIYNISVPANITRVDATRVRSVARLGLRAGGRLGPLTVSPPPGHLFVADIVNGDLYDVNYNQGRSRLVANGLGQPSSLFLNTTSVRAILYSLDSVGRKVYWMDVQAFEDFVGVTSPRVYAKSSLFREPISMSIASSGSLLIGDRKAQQIFLVRNGTVSVP
jgi:hypothetical protein